MSDDDRGGLEIDSRHLASILQVLANANRIDLIRQLRDPKSASEIRLAPEDARDGNPDRAMSVQAVRFHLARLAEIGVVSARSRPSGGVDEYVLNKQRLFAIGEEFRSLAHLEPAQAVDEGATIRGPMPRHDVPSAGARLILVHGFDEGRSFPLRLDEISGERGWVIGRRSGVPVCLDYDPFASSENAEITWANGTYVLHDIRSSRNGTSINWEPMAKGASRALRHGDVIGIGHSLLLFKLD